MEEKKSSNKQSLISSIRNRIEQKQSGNQITIQDLTDKKLIILLGELQKAQLELEMQNDEILASSQLLANERAKFKDFFELAPMGYFVLDRLGFIQETNKVGADLLAISQHSAVGQKLQRFIDPLDWENFYSFLHKMLTADGRHRKGMKILLDDGTVYHTQIDGIATTNSFTEQIQYYITIVDISEIKQAQQRLIDTSKRLELTLTVSGTGTWSIDLRANKVFFDKSCYALFEINPWEYDGSLKGLISLIHPDDQQKVKQELSKAQGSFRNIDLVFRVICKGNRIKLIAAKGHEVSYDTYAPYYVGILVDLTEHEKNAHEKQAQLEEHQKLILSTAFNAQEKERTKISAALHDSVCQLLYGARLNLQQISPKANLKEKLKNVSELLDQAIAETRALSYDLTPSVLRDFGFTAGIKEIAQKFSSAKFKITTKLRNSVDEIEPNLQLFVFRIMQELINNCIKHASATRVEINVYTEGDFITLTVSDNGKGFEQSLDESLLKGSGLRGIKSRVFLLNGTMEVGTSSQGTEITIQVSKGIISDN